MKKTICMVLALAMVLGLAACGSSSNTTTPATTAPAAAGPSSLSVCLASEPDSIDPALNAPSGCPFRTRCPYASDICAQSMPEFKDVGGGHFVACHNLDKIG